MEQKVDPGVENGVRYYATSATSIITNKLTGLRNTVAHNYPSNVRGVHNRELGSALEMNGWRPPTGYRVYAAKADGGPFDFTRDAGSESVRSSSDMTDLSGGFGPPSGMQAWGTRVAGGLRIPDVSQNMINRSVAEALLKLQNRKLDLLATFGEAKTTFNTILTLVSRLAEFFKHLRKLNFLAAFNSLLSNTTRKQGKLVMSKHHYTKLFATYDSKGRPLGGRSKLWKFSDAAKNNVRGTYYTLSRKDVVKIRGLTADEAWLEFQYGVLPLVWEIKGAIAAFDAGIRENGALIKGLRRLEQDYGMPTQPAAYVQWACTGTAKIGVETQVYASIDNAYVDALNRWGLSDFISSAWELVPYSFVIDWLVPVGNLLKALNARTGILFKGGYTNTKTVLNLTIKCCKYSPTIGPIPNVRVANVCQKRTTIVSMPIPRAYFKSPFSTTHTISAIALIQNVTRPR